MTHIHKSVAIFVALGLLLWNSAAPGARRQAVPAPADVLGFTPGDDYKLADFRQIEDYFEKLDAASDRVTVSSAGKSTEGRDMLVAVISSDANLRELARYKDIAQRLAHVRGLSDADARALAAEGKAIVWIDNGLHASEVASAQHAMTLAWRVATDESPEMRAIRDNVILVLLPTINPDGLDKVVDWYRRTLNTPNQDSPMPWLYQKYIGHDNNRDFYMQTQAETRVLSRLLYEEWLPEILYNQHQGTWPPRIFVPPFPDPFNPNIDPLIMRSIDLVGGAMLRRFESEGKDGVISRHEFSTWYDGSIRTTAYFHNILGILTETGHASATPFTYDPADFPRELDDGISTAEPSTNYPSPWKGGTLHLKDAVDYMLTGSLAVLDVAAKYREAFLYGIYQIGARQIEKGKTEAPFAYVIPPQQHDLPAAALFVETLMRGGVEIHRADAPFTADGKVYDAGSWVVRLDQPFRPFAKDLLEAQHYPDIRTSPGGPPVPPYDIAGWTLAYQMGVHATAIQKPFDAPLTRLDAYPTVTGRIRTGPDSVQDERNARADAIAAPGLYILDPIREPGLCGRQRVAGGGSSRITRHDTAGGERAGVDQRRVRRVRTDACAGRAADDDGSTPRSDGGSSRAAEDDRVAGDSSGACRPVSQLDREHRRRLDALGARAVRLPVHDGHQRGRPGGSSRGSLRRRRPAFAVAARHCRRPQARRTAAA